MMREGGILDEILQTLLGCCLLVPWALFYGAMGAWSRLRRLV